MLRMRNRETAAKHPDTKHLFSGNAATRQADAEARFEKAIQATSKLSTQVVSKRIAENQQWANAALESAKTAPIGLFSDAWWKKHPTTDGYSTTKPAPTWWHYSDWDELVRNIALTNDTQPFVFMNDLNLTFKNDVIYVTGVAISSYADFVASARKLANSGAQGSSTGTGWSPLGTFALSTSLKTKKAPHALQLAVDKNGNIGGTYVNWPEGTVQAIHGKVDPKTQRVAFNLGDHITVETGLANFAADQTRLWAHLPNLHSQTWLIARMKPGAE
jgi:hypothetical protein